MKMSINHNQLAGTYHQFLRQAGYEYIEDRQTGHASFVRKLGGGRYPRFHMYVDELADKLVFNLHLDQKQAIYEGTTAHSGEYDGEQVAAEGERLKSLLGNSPKTSTRKSESSNPWSIFKR